MTGALSLLPETETVQAENEILETMKMDSRGYYLFEAIVSELQKRGFVIEFGDCFLAVHDRNQFHMQICKAFEIEATAPNGIVIAKIDLCKEDNSVDCDIMVDKKWRSGFLSQIAMAAEKKVDCVWCRMGDCHNHLQTAILDGRVSDFGKIPEIVGHIAKLDHAIHELWLKFKDEEERFSSELVACKTAREEREVATRKEIERLKLSINDDLNNFIAFIRLREMEFEELLMRPVKDS